MGYYSIMINLKRSFKKLLPLFVFLVVLQGCAGNPLQHSAPLSKEHKASVLAYNIVSAVDMLQTREIQSNPRYTEVNPLIGDSDTEIAGYFVAKSVLHYGITRIIPEKYRTGWLTISIVPSIVAVGNNHSIGVDMKF